MVETAKKSSAETLKEIGGTFDIVGTHINADMVRTTGRKYLNAGSAE
jgi:hypothetical protein